MTRIYLSAPHMGGAEQRYVQEAFSSNWLSSVGPNLDAFEAEFSRRLGLSSVALASGTAAIHLGLRALGVGPGDKVLCPTFTFVATANPITYLGAQPVFVDSETRSWNVDPQLLEQAIVEHRPRAMIVVHLFGQSADLDAIHALSERYGVPVLEDCAEALGTTYRGQPVGRQSAVSIFSFNGNKIITTTGGGMLAARDAAIVEKVRHWSTQARDPGIGYCHSELGYNYRLSNVLAGIGRGQLEVLEQRVAARRRIAFRYQEALADVAGIRLMPQADWGLHTNWLSVFELDEATLGVSRDGLVGELAKLDIEARPVWKPLHVQPLFAAAPCVGGPVSERLFARGICLPSSSNLSESDQSRVIDAVRAAIPALRARPAQVAHV